MFYFDTHFFFQTLCQINVTIQVLDANDNAPVFTHTDYSFDLEDDHNEIGRVLVCTILCYTSKSYVMLERVCIFNLVLLLKVWNQ